jgi:hypothetical protein
MFHQNGASCEPRILGHVLLTAGNISDFYPFQSNQRSLKQDDVVSAPRCTSAAVGARAVTTHISMYA